MFKLTLTGVLALIVVAGCKKEPDPNSYPCQTGCNLLLPTFYYIIADNQGQSLLPPGTDGVGLAYLDGGKLFSVSVLDYPINTEPGATVPLLMNGGFLAERSGKGFKIFYLTYKGKTDTLGLDIHRVTPVTATNNGNSTPVVTFNGRPMQSASSGLHSPIYFVLKRR